MGITAQQQLEKARKDRDAARDCVINLRKQLAEEKDPFYKDIIAEDLKDAEFEYRSQQDYVDDLIIDMSYEARQL